MSGRLLQAIKSVDPKDMLTLLHRVIEYFQAPMLAAHRKNRNAPSYVAQMVTVLVAELPASRRCLSSAATPSRVRPVVGWCPGPACALPDCWALVCFLAGSGSNGKPSMQQASLTLYLWLHGSWLLHAWCPA